MTASKAQIRATAKYKEKAYKRVPLDVPKDFYEVLKEAAQIREMSINGFIKKAIEEKIEREK